MYFLLVSHLGSFDSKVKVILVLSNIPFDLKDFILATAGLVSRLYYQSKYL